MVRRWRWTKRRTDIRAMLLGDDGKKWTVDQLKAHMQAVTESAGEGRRPEDIARTVACWHRDIGEVAARIADQLAPERCSGCGYTEEDKRLHGDHHLCPTSDAQTRNA